MNNHAFARKIAAVVSIMGWILLVFSMITLAAGAFFGFMHFSGNLVIQSTGFLNLLLPGILGITLSFLIVLGGYVARAVFDIAESAGRGQS